MQNPEIKLITKKLIILKWQDLSEKHLLVYMTSPKK